jgi:hypothetical protein
MKLRKWLWVSGLVAGIALAAVILYTRVIKPAPTGGASQPPPEVAITEPVQGAQFSLGSPVPVEVRVYGEYEVQSIELWVDGQLLGQQGAGASGAKPLPVSFLWLPSNPGLHSLAARALGPDSPLAYSDVTLVEVYAASPGEEGDDPADHALPAVLPAAEGLPSFEPPPSEQALALAQPWQGAPGQASAPAGSNPAAPNLIARAEGCGAELLIDDLALDEAGFRIYRQASNTQAWMQVAQLASLENTGWFAYTDNAYPGGMIYYVASFNAAGESPGNMVQVNIDEQDCPPLAADGPVLELDPYQLLANSGADRAYCYRTLDEVHWERTPGNGFFVLNDPPVAPQDALHLSLAGLNQAGRQADLDLQLDCWGWKGNVLKHLGNFRHTFDLTSISTLPQQIGASIFKPGMTLLHDAGSPALRPLSGSSGNINLDPGLLHLLPQLDGSMPYFYLSSTDDPQQCKQHLPPEFQNLVGQLLFCSPYPGFNVGPGGDNPQLHLIWDVQGTCPNGSGPACTTYESWLSKAEQEGGDVWFTVYDWSSAGYHTWTVDGANMRNWTIKPLECSGTRDFQIKMFYSDADEVLVGFPSNLYSIDCPHPTPWIIPLEISFDTIRFYNLDDGDNGSVVQDVEVFGYLSAHTSQGNRYLNLAEWNEQADHCPDESVQPSVMGTMIVDGCTKVFEDLQAESLSEYALCQSTSKYNCSINGWNFDNNTVRLGVDDGDGMMLQVLIVDWDDASANDLQCLAFLLLPPLDRLAWAKVQNQSFTIDSPDWGSGSCRIQGTLRAVLP